MNRIVHCKSAIIIVALFTLINLVDIFEYFIYEESSYLRLALPLFSGNGSPEGETGEASAKNPVIHMQRTFVALVSLVLSVEYFTNGTCVKHTLFLASTVHSQIFVLTERPPPAVV